MTSSKQGKQADKVWMAFWFMGAQPSSAGCADSCGKGRQPETVPIGSVLKAEEVQMHRSNLQRNRVGVKGDCGSVAALVLRADKTSFRA